MKGGFDVVALEHVLVDGHRDDRRGVTDALAHNLERNPFSQQSCHIGVANGTRLTTRTALVIAGVLSAWVAADIALHSTTSPLTAVARLAVFPVQPRPAAPILEGIASIVAVCVVAVARVGGLSIERARGRAALSAQLRVALYLNDVRSAVLVYRRASAGPVRSRPWFPAPRTLALGPTATRSLHELARWSGHRVARFVAMAGVAGIVIAYGGTAHALFGIPVGLAAYLSALDAVEPIAQDADHPWLRDSVPTRSGFILRRQAGVALALMCMWSSLAALVVAATAPRMLPSIAGVAVPLAFAATAGAVMTTQRIARPLFDGADIGKLAATIVVRSAFRVTAPIAMPVLTAAIVVGATNEQLLLRSGLSFAVAVVMFFSQTAGSIPEQRR